MLTRIRERIFLLLETLGIEHGLCHTEIKIDGEQVHLIETHARPAGDRIWRLMELALASIPSRSVSPRLSDGRQRFPTKCRRRALPQSAM
ncbi:MAG: hypothetical protein HPM95_03955 [Alphaproteobacteria bacterium]|nr:hypothetical protein [Alphaproteobacteria bacterium]